MFCTGSQKCKSKLQAAQHQSGAEMAAAHIAELQSAAHQLEAQNGQLRVELARQTELGAEGSAKLESQREEAIAVRMQLVQAGRALAMAQTGGWAGDEAAAGGQSQGLAGHGAESTVLEKDTLQVEP